MKRHGPSILLIVLAACAARSWILRAPFRIDDLETYAKSGPFLEELGDRIGRFMTGAALPDWRPRCDIFRANYRPVDWFLKSIEPADGGSPRPSVSFAVTLALHAATAVAAFLLGLRVTSPSGALIGALLVAVCPTGAQAHSWLAVRGDVLVALFSALALWATLGEAGTTKRRFLRGLSSGALVALALSSKENGLFVIPLMALPALVGLRRPSPALLAGSAVTIGIGLLVRFIWLGTWLPVDYRSTAASTIGLEWLATGIGDRATSAVSLLRTFLNEPWESLHGPCLVPASLAWLLPVRQAVPFAVAALAAALLSGSGLRRTLVLLITGIAALLVAPWFVWMNDAPLYYDRSLLAAVPLLGVLLGSAVRTGWARAGPMRAMTVSAVAVLLLGWAHHDLDLRAATDLCVADVAHREDALAKCASQPDAFAVVVWPALPPRGQILGIARGIPERMIHVLDKDLDRYLTDYHFIHCSSAPGISRFVVLRTRAVGEPYEAAEGPARVSSLEILRRESPKDQARLEFETGARTTLGLMLRGALATGWPYEFDLESRLVDGKLIRSRAEKVPVVESDGMVLPLTPLDLNGVWLWPGRHVLRIVGPRAHTITVAPMGRSAMVPRPGFVTGSGLGLRVPLVPMDTVFVEALVIAPELTNVPGYFYWDRGTLDSGPPVLDFATADHFSPEGGKERAVAALRTYGGPLGVVVSLVTPGGGWTCSATIRP